MLKVNHVNKSYGGRKALQDFSRVLEPGEIYDLLDADGSDKTTPMKLIANLILPNSGEILLNGTSISAANRAHIAYMSTEPYFYPHMKTKDVGKYYRDFFANFSQETYREILDTFQLDPNLRTKSLPSSMMAGMKVAVTMSQRADVILLDEPLNGIDLIARDQAMDLVTSRAGRESALLLSSHLIEEMGHFISKTIFVENDSMTVDLDIEELRVKEGLSLAGKYRRLLA